MAVWLMPYDNLGERIDAKALWTELLTTAHAAYLETVYERCTLCGSLLPLAELSNYLPEDEYFCLPCEHTLAKQEQDEIAALEQMFNA